MNAPQKDPRRQDGPISGALSRLYQMLARSGPGASSLRVWLHRQRGVTLGEGCWIGYDCILETSYPRLIVLKNRVTLSVRVTIVAHFSTTAGVTIEDDVFIGPCVTILPSVTIGEGSVISAGTVVTRPVPPRTVVQGNPGRFVGTCAVPLTNETPPHVFARGFKPIRNA